MRYTVKAAALATGVSESRLRTWERRYGIPSPDRSATGRRLYDERDLTVIRRMAALVEAGISASEAAAAARIEGPMPAIKPARVEHPLAASLVAASVSYDEPAAETVITEAVQSLGWGRALDDVVMPALRHMGQFWGDETIVSATEHFATEVVRRQIASAYVSTPAADETAPSSLLACPEEERHEVGLLGLALLLRLDGLGVFYLGADVPAYDLIVAARDSNADAVCLSATLDSSVATLRRTARTFVSSRLRVRLFVGGPAFTNGARVEDVPGVHLPPSLSAAADLINKSLRGTQKEVSK